MRSPSWVRLQRLFLVFLTTKNWLSSILVWIGFYQMKIVVFRNGMQFRLEKSNWVTYLEHVYLFHHFPEAKVFGDSLQIRYKNIDLVFDGGRYGWSTILEIFGGEPYLEFFEMTEIRGKTVLDVGAAFGDTAVLFMLEGAARVVAVEAFPGYFKLASKNIKANGFDSQCEIMLSAIGAHSGILRIDTSLNDMFGIGVQENEIGEEVPIITIEQIIKDKNIKDAILKLDVEGYEYEILLNTPKDVLRNFSDMVIEYHYGHEKIISHLEAAGYSVSFTGPFDVKMLHLKDEAAKNMKIGNIYAKRLDFQ